MIWIVPGYVESAHDYTYFALRCTLASTSHNLGSKVFNLWYWQEYSLSLSLHPPHSCTHTHVHIYYTHTSLLINQSLSGSGCRQSFSNCIPVEKITRRFWWLVLESLNVYLEWVISITSMEHPDLNQSQCACSEHDNASNFHYSYNNGCGTGIFWSVIHDLWVSFYTCASWLLNFFYVCLRLACIPVWTCTRKRWLHRKHTHVHVHLAQFGYICMYMAQIILNGYIYMYTALNRVGYHRSSCAISQFSWGTCA